MGGYFSVGVYQNKLKINPEALLGNLLREVRIQEITHKKVKKPNIRPKKSIFNCLMIVSQILEGSIDPPDPL